MTTPTRADKQDAWQESLDRAPAPTGRVNASYPDREEQQVHLAVPPSDQVDLARFGKPFAGEPAHGLQHPVARLGRPPTLVDHEQGALGQGREPFDGGRRADVEVRLDVEPAGEHGAYAEAGKKQCAVHIPALRDARRRGTIWRVTEHDAAESKAIFREFVELVMNRGDLSAIDELFAAEFVGHVRLPPAPTLDREGVKALFATYRSAFSGFHTTIDQLIAEGDRIAGLLTARGTHTGSFMGIPATNREVAFRTMDIFRIAEGKIAEHWAMPDQFGLRQQLT
jgi:steroid delta-isomerase-like uncharacterized protein